MKFATSVAVPIAVVAASAYFSTTMAVPTNPKVEAGRSIQAHLSIPTNVQKILVRSCYDCHSNETHWPWYAGVPGVSSSIQSHVQRARARLNLSDWSGKLAEGPDEAQASLNGICEELRSETMPLPQYRWIHRNAALSPSDVESVCRWTMAAQKK